MIDVYNPKDLANGYYPHLRRLALNDPEWNDILSWFVSKGIPNYTKFYTPKGIDPVVNAVVMLPTEIHWEKSGAETLKLDAALVFNFPHVALVELKNYFGVGDPRVLEMYPGLRKPLVEVARNPIGAPWPERGPNAFRPSAEDNFEYGAVVTTPAGTFTKERRGWAFISFPVWVRREEPINA